MKCAAFLAILGLVALLAGCDSNPIGGSSWPDDAIKANQRAQVNAPVLRATDLPPGLGDDLPPSYVSSQALPPTTQPTARND